VTLAIDQPSASRPSLHTHGRSPFQRWEAAALGLVLAIAAFLDFFGLSREGWANTYYSAAVRSLLQSWHNFFFVAFDPGGFVSVDKPPLGFWVQTASAKLFGFHGWSLLLPQAVAGVASVLVLFLIVRRAFGPLAGLIAAAALALTPVAVADNRNNTIDSLLVLCLLLAAWATLKATDRGRLAWLLLGMALVGLGFNIKMLEAYLALPALVALYCFGAPVRWRTRFWHLGVAVAVLLLVSLSWAVAVDLTPPSQRPYVGSSQHNSELELAFGYNGLQRLEGMALPGGARRSAVRASTPSTDRPSATDASPSPATPAVPPASSENAPSAAFQPPQGGGPPGFVEGGPSGLRLFDTQLGGQASWLLPLAIFGLVAGALVTTPVHRRLSLRGLLQMRLNAGQRQLVLWGVWLAVVAAFFSVAGFFNPYYLITLAPAAAALAGIGAVALWRLAHGRTSAGWLLPAALLAGAAVQVSLLQAYPQWSDRLASPLLVLCILGAVLAAIVLLRPSASGRLRQILTVSLALGLAGLLLTPAVWSGLTMAQGDGGMPSGGPSAFRSFARQQITRLDVTRAATADLLGGELPAGFTPPPGGPPPSFPGAEGPAGESKLISYLEANRGDSKFMLAVPSSMAASSIIIQTGQPVMAMGGFSGGDPILTTADLARDVKDGVVRFFLIQGVRRTPAANAGTASGRPGAQPGAPAGATTLAGRPGPFGGQTVLESWVAANCTPVPNSAWQATDIGAAGGGFGFGAQQLYDCASPGAS
jgi:4-amino-4-deoxy-L-arabinose transferase-like glycosyltransferase